MKSCLCRVGGKAKCALSPLFLAIGLWLLASCDVASSLSFTDGTKSRTLQTPNGTVDVGAFYFKTVNYLSFNLKGNYEINPDSLLITFDDERVSFVSAVSDKTAGGNISNRENIANCDIRTRLTLRITGNNVDLNPINMYVLPCHYLTCNGKPVLTDTLKISMRCNIKNFFWEKTKPRPLANRKR